MNFKNVVILLLLQTFLFIQCSTAETSDVKEKKSNKAVKHSFVDTTNIASVSNATSLTDKKNDAVAKKNESIKQENFKQIQFGFNIGYLVDLKKPNLFVKPLQQIKQDGITKLRIYEPFTKNMLQQPGLVPQLLKPLEQNGFQILFDLSNFPDVSSIQYNRNGNSPEQNQMMSFTNRNAPVNLDAYTSYLTDYLDKLQAQGLLQNVNFEIGNEPDAKKYFWGQSSDFIKVARAIKQTLAKYNKEVYCCGFTSEFANKGSEKNQDYYSFINDHAFFQNVNLSFHFYQNDKNDITQVKLPRLDNSIITEFNMYSYQKKSTTNKTGETNSAQFASLLIKTLLFSYRNNINTIYLFKLVDMPDKEGTTGFFDENGNAKPSYTYFKSIYDVVKNKYAVRQDNNSIIITGDAKTIIYATGNNIKIPNNTVVSSSGNLNGKTLSKDQWVILEN